MLAAVQRQELLGRLLLDRRRQRPGGGPGPAPTGRCGAQQSTPHLTAPPTRPLSRIDPATPIQRVRDVQHAPPRAARARWRPSRTCVAQTDAEKAVFGELRPHVARSSLSPVPNESAAAGPCAVFG